MRPQFAARAFAVLLIAVSAGFAKTSPVLPGLQRDGSVLLPNQWSLRPVGKEVQVGDFPVNVALHPAGKFAAVLHSGYSQHEVRIIDVKTGLSVSQVSLEESFYGLAWSPDGKKLYASGASNETVNEFAFADGYLSGWREIRLRAIDERGMPGGLAVSADGAAIYVADCLGQRVEKISVSDGRAVWTRQLAAMTSHGEMSDPEAERLKPGYDPESPFPYTCLPDERNNRVFVTLWGKSSVLVLDAKSGSDIARWSVGAHPNEMALGKDGRLFVAESNLNSVSVIDTSSGKVAETLVASLFPNSPPGTMPNSVALAPDEKTLFVANANNNDVAAF